MNLFYIGGSHSYNKVTSIDKLIDHTDNLTRVRPPTNNWAHFSYVFSASFDVVVLLKREVDYIKGHLIANGYSPTFLSLMVAEELTNDFSTIRHLRLFATKGAINFLVKSNKGVRDNIRSLYKLSVNSRGQLEDYNKLRKKSWR